MRFDIVLDLLLSLWSAPECGACRAAVRRPAVFCPACATTIVRSSAGPVPSYGDFGGALADAIRRLKYGDRPDLARPLGALLRHALGPAPPRVDCVVPVPLHPRRLASRRYNQSALLARNLADVLDVPLDTRSLRRIRDTPAQAALDAAERRRNVADAFVADARLAGRSVLLVDDVCTTGATLEACHVALRIGGVCQIHDVVLARAVDATSGSS